MNKFVLAIYDNTAKVFGQVITAPNVGSVTRELVDMMQDGNTTIAKHPEDFSLYQIGYFDDETGDIKPMQPDKLYSLASLLQARQ